MHGFDTSIPRFVTQVWGIRIVVTPELISDVLHVPKVEFLDYPESLSADCVQRQILVFFLWDIFFIGWSLKDSMVGLCKRSRFLNMVITFVLHPLSHYNSITEPRACFLLSLIEDLTIDFPSHFILSLIDIYRNTATRDKFIFPSAIMRIIRHSSVSYLESPHYSIMRAINTVSVRRSKAHLSLKWPRTETTTPPTHSAPSSSALSSSSTGGVTLEAIMA